MTEIPNPEITSAAAQKLRSKDRDAILQSLRAGVVPRRGHQHIQVGRADEVRALLQDLDRVADGGSAMRFIIGEYGSGKTFFLHLVRSIGLEKGLVAAQTDLSPSRRLHSTGGEARTLYADLMANLATRTRPEGGAMPSVVERFVTSALQESRAAASPPARSSTRGSPPSPKCPAATTSPKSSPPTGRATTKATTVSSPTPCAGCGASSPPAPTPARL